MPVLVEQDRFEVWANFMRNGPGLVTISKGELRSAFDAIDSWADSNAASLNSAIPQPARANLTAKQKAQILVYVIQRRFERA